MIFDVIYCIRQRFNKIAKNIHPVILPILKQGFLLVYEAIDIAFSKSRIDIIHRGY